MRLAFLGTPVAAVASLEALVAAGHDVALVISQPDRRRGRGSALSPSPVKEAALRLGLKVADSLDALKSVSVERGVVVAYGAMIPADVLAAVPMLNVHFSLLPRWRGAAPVERAILAGDETTGVDIISLEESLDTGPIHGRHIVEVGHKTASQLTNELSVVGASLLVDVLASAEALAHPVAQEGPSTYAAKLRPATFELLPTMSAVEAERVVRLEKAFSFVNGRRVRVVRGRRVGVAVPAGTLTRQGAEVLWGHGAESLLVSAVLPEGGRVMDAGDWWSGARLHDGTRWGPLTTHTT